MINRQIIHIVDSDARSRAQFARAVFSLGHHAEVYANLAELSERPPERGVIFIRDAIESGGIAAVVQLLVQQRICLPLVAMDETPSTAAVVAAIKAGALEYFPLPMEVSQLSQMLQKISGEVQLRANANRRMLDARNKLDNLSSREREVLDWLAQGNTNKAIALELQISPRTVEIHRANMMSKLGVNHPAEAVRLRLEASL